MIHALTLGTLPRWSIPSSTHSGNESARNCDVTVVFSFHHEMQSGQGVVRNHCGLFEPQCFCRGEGKSVPNHQQTKSIRTPNAACFGAADTGGTGVAAARNQA